MSLFSLAILSLGAEYMNATLGMGYGTTLTPILLLLGYPPDVIVPTVLLSGLVTGLVSGGFHHAFGNLALNRGSRDWGVITILASMGAVGVVAAVIASVRLPEVAQKTYIGSMVFVMGLLLFLLRNRHVRFSWPRIIVVGAVAAFNKGMSGGGFGPLVVSGQILSGHGVRNAVGVACLTEGLICTVGFPLYLVMNDGAGWLTAHWGFYVPILAGAVIAAPMASWTTRVAVHRFDMRLIIAVVTCTLGAWTLWDTLHSAVGG